jgi:predicted Zn-dependent peptidase
LIGLRFAMLLSLGALVLPAQDLRDYEKKVTEFTLANGLHFILVERHQVPVVSFHTYVTAGSAQDPAGKTGLASLIARLAFDGTETIGSRNWPAEKKALDEVEQVFDRVDEERAKGPKSSPGALAVLEAGETPALGTAFREQNTDEYLHAIQENGGAGIDSHATPDSIEASYSLPSNRIELWFALESQRLAHPVFRNFYRERRKLSNEVAAVMGPQSQARLRQSLLSTAFENLPYRNPVLGWRSDVEGLRLADAKAFLDTYGGPGNTIVSIVGDVDPAGAQRLAERYFGPIPTRGRPRAMDLQEAPQAGPKTVAIWSDSQPLIMIGYKRPAETHRDDPALDIAATILGDPRTGWLGKELVEERRIAQNVEAIANFPSGRYVSLFMLSAAPENGRSVEENRKAIDELLARLQSKPVDAETLARAKNILRAKFIRMLGSNRELAALLPLVYANYGDWRKLFAIVDEYGRLSAEDIQRVAAQYFVPTGRTTAYLTRPQEPGRAISNPGEQQ